MGVGKTTFIQRWISLLKIEQIPTVYLDAFSVDYLENPFVAIAGAVSEATKRASKNNDPKFAAFMNAAAKVGKAFGTTVVKSSVRAATLGIMDLGEFGDTLSASLSEEAEGVVKKLIDDHEHKKQEIAALRTSLAALSDELSSGSNETASPLVIVIDELDRCRPDFALGVLECIKHFFGTDGVVFVLVSNSAQLESSIRHRYGPGVRGNEYLRKFIDLRIDYVLDYSERQGTKLSRAIAEASSVLLPRSESSRDVEGYIRDMARAYRLSLRDIENIFANLALVYAVENRLYKPAVLVAFLVTIKLLEPELYRKAKSKELTYQDVEKFIIRGTWYNFNVERLSTLLRWHLQEEVETDGPEFRGYAESTWQYSLERLDTIRFLCNSIIDRFEVPA